MQNYAIKARLSVPTVSMKAHGDYYFEVLSPVIPKRDPQNPEKVVSVMRVIDLSTEQSGEIVLGKVLLDILSAIPAEELVGKKLHIRKVPGKPDTPTGRGYNLYYVDEIECEELAPGLG